METAYELHLPRGKHPWVYLSLRLDPSTVDVNVHPTKEELVFLNQAKIISILRESMTSALLRTQKSRKFDVQVCPLSGCRVSS